MKTIFRLLFLYLVVFSCSNNNASYQTSDEQIPVNDPALFAEGKLVAGDLAKEEADQYELEVTAGSFVFGQVNQKTLDVEVSIIDPTGEEIASFDGPASGMENFNFDAVIEGTYKIEVSPFEEQEGEYTIQLLKMEPLADNPGEKVDQLLSAYDNDFTPGAVVGVIENGEVTYDKGFGMANLAYDIAFTTDMPSNIGSVSKQFTAMGILLLEKEGKLSLEDDIRTHLPELPDFGKTIRIKNLLNHTNGLREIYNMMPMRGWDGEDNLLREEAIRIVQRQPELQADPGEEFNYNNTAFILLTHIVERITDQTFPEYMQEKVFAPLEMNNTHIRRDPGHIIPNAAQGYISDDNGFREAGDLYAAYGAGGIYTTIGDFAKWLQNFHDPQLGGADIIKKLTTPDTLNNGDTMSYALGLGISEYKGLKRYSHTGGDIAHRTNLVYFPEINKGVVTNSNNGAFSLAVTNDIIDVFLEEHLEIEEEEIEKDIEENEEKARLASPEQIEAYVGKYQSEQLGIIIEVTLEGDQLKAEFAGQDPLNLKAISDKEFEYQGVEATLTFHTEDNEVTGATHSQGGSDYSFERTAGFDPSKEELQAYTGRYFSKEIETVYTITYEEEVLKVEIYGSEKIELSPLEFDKFSSDAFFIAEMAFTRNSSGKVIGFAVGNGRTKGVKFERMSNI